MYSVSEAVKYVPCDCGAFTLLSCKQGVQEMGSCIDKLGWFPVFSDYNKYETNQAN